MTGNVRILADRALLCLPDDLRVILMKKILSLLGRSGIRKIPVAIFRGATRGSGQSGSLLLAGHEPWIRYILHRFFQGEPAREPVGEYRFPALPPVLDRLGAETDLTVARIDRQSAKRFFSHQYLRVPEWVGTIIQVPENLETLVKSGGSIKGDMVLVRRHRYQPVLTHGTQDFQFFYRKIYLPFTQNRHGEMSVLRREADLRRRAARGGILWMQRDGKRVAAILFQRKNNLLDILALGTLEGNLNLVREGAIAALYYFLLKWAGEIGCTTLDFRGSRPSLSDGLLRYKKKWGGTLYDKTDSYHDLLFRWHQGNPVVEEFLSHTPLIFREAEGFSALLANELQGEKELWVDGLRRCWYLKDWERNRLLPGDKEAGTTLCAG